MKLEELKSARIVTDAGEIATMLNKAHTSNPCANSLVRVDKDGRAVVTKRSSLLAIKKLPSEQELAALALARGYPNTADIVSRVMPYWASDERVDGHGDIVKQNWIFTEFEKSPILAFSHNWQDPPIGGVIDWQVEQRDEADYSGPALMLLTFFATAETYAFADTIYRLVASRILRGGSVGFYAQKVIDITDQDEREALGLGRWGYVLDNNMLVEFSPTTVGANPGALSIYSEAKRKGLLKQEDAPVLRELVRRQVKASGGKDAWSQVDDVYRSFFNVIFPGSNLKRHVDFDQPFIVSDKSSPKTSSPKTKADAASIEEQITNLTGMVTTLMDVVSGMVTAVEDIRTMVEADATPAPDGEDTDPATEAGADKGKSFLQRVASHTGK